MSHWLECPSCNHKVDFRDHCNLIEIACPECWQVSVRREWSEYISIKDVELT